MHCLYYSGRLYVRWYESRGEKEVGGGFEPPYKLLQSLA